MRRCTLDNALLNHLTHLVKDVLFQVLKGLVLVCRIVFRDFPDSVALLSNDVIRRGDKGDGKYC